MKRSKMLKLMSDYISKVCNNGDRCAEDLDVMDDLLVRMQNIGILPPLCDDAKELYYTSDHDSRDIGKAYDYFKWDKE